MDDIQDLVIRHQKEIPEWGHLPAAMRFKQDLVSRVGIDRAFAFCQQLLEVPDLNYLSERTTMPLGSAAKTFGGNFSLLWEGGKSFVQMPPRVVGCGNHQPIYGRTRSAYLACFANVNIRSRSAVIALDDNALVDAEDAETDGIPDNPEYDPGILHARGSRLWMMDATSPAVEVGEAFMLSGSHTIDFGHWMTEYLPKYMLALRSGLPEEIPLLVDGRMPQTIRDALPLLAGKAPIIEIPYLAQARVNRLWSAPNANFMGFYPTVWTTTLWSRMAAEPNRFASLIQMLVQRFGDKIQEPTGISKVFLSRRPNLVKKRLINIREIEDLAKDAGFAIIYPEDHDLVTQVRLAHHAKYIAGPEGSNCFLAFFARPGTSVCILSPPYTFPLVDMSSILSALGLDVTLVTGPSVSEDELCPFWNHYSISPEGLRAFLREWLQTPSD